MTTETGSEDFCCRGECCGLGSWCCSHAGPHDHDDDRDRCKWALQACWDEYNELMPDALHAQVKAALGIREFVAGGDDTDA